MPKPVLSIIFICFLSTIYAQKITHSLVGGNAIHAKTRNFQIDLSLGELAIKTLQKQDIEITQGYLQPSSIYVIIKSQDSVCLGDSIILTASIAHSYEWKNDISEILSTDSVFVFEPIDRLTYLQLTINDSIHLNTTVYLKPPKNCPISLIVYELISPNDDFKNNVFLIENLEYAPNHLISVYDKWGIEVFSSNNYENDWTANELNDGVYIYIVKDLDRNKTYTNKLFVKR